MQQVVDVILRKLGEHTSVTDAVVTALGRLMPQLRALAPRQDIVRQGDRPKASVVVLSGMLSRYNTLPNGRRQYLSFHIAGDLPDVQALFIEKMDHAVCAIDEAQVALVPHEQLRELVAKVPDLAVALWRETLIDAAIFREAITNNSARDPRTRIAHFLCERYYRVRAGRHERPGFCDLPLSQMQLGEALGISVVTVNRTLQQLRRTKAMDWAGHRLQVLNWNRLCELGQFDPSYLHLRRPPRV